jgi:cytochrome bd-type quinol oxidase subunit 1
MAITLVGFTLLYGSLAVVEVGLLMRRIRAGLADTTQTPGEDDKPAAFAY